MNDITFNSLEDAANFFKEHPLDKMIRERREYENKLIDAKVLAEQFVGYTWSGDNRSFRGDSPFKRFTVDSDVVSTEYKQVVVHYDEEFKNLEILFLGIEDRMRVEPRFNGMCVTRKDLQFICKLLQVPDMPKGWGNDIQNL